MSGWLTLRVALGILVATGLFVGGMGVGRAPVLLLGLPGPGHAWRPPTARTARISSATSGT